VRSAELLKKAATIGPTALPASLALWLLATPAIAQQVSREEAIVDLRLGQRVLVDDGSCPAGQIKEVQGSQMTTSGVLRTRKCIPRLGTKRR
jgi:uncharacterized protein DUF6719